MSATAAPREIPMEHAARGGARAPAPGLPPGDRPGAHGRLAQGRLGRLLRRGPRRARRWPPLHPPGGRARRAGRRGGAARSLARRGGGADPGAGQPPGAPVAGGRLLRPSLARAHGRRDHRDEREDDDVVSSARRSSRPAVSPRASSARSSTSCAATRATPARPRPRRSSSRGSWPRWWRRGSAGSPWRCPPTPSRSTASTPSPSTWPCSRTSPRTTSTFTARWRRMRPPSAGSSPSSCRPAASPARRRCSTRMTRPERNGPPRSPAAC